MRTRKTRRRGRTPSGAAPAASPAPPTRPAYPRGNPLSDSVTVVDSLGTSWIVYIEPAPPEVPLRRNAALLPGRRLRFDSLDGSLVASPVPAGSPFLPDSRLLALLAQAGPVPKPAPPVPTVMAGARAISSVDWASSLAGAVGAAGQAAERGWQATARIRRTCAHGLVQIVAPAALLLIVVWETILVRPRARI